jgi:hypothetical protein
VRYWLSAPMLAVYRLALRYPAGWLQKLAGDSCLSFPRQAALWKRG